MNDDLLKYLSDRINKEIQVMTDDMAMGKAKDFGDYKHAVGMLRGLMVANSIIAETAERVKSND